MKYLTIIYAILSLSSCSTIKISNPIIDTEKISIRTTSYTHNEKDHIKYGNKTAIGTTLKKDKSIAADISIFPIGTKMKIGNIVYEVDDYGSALIHSEVKPVPTVDIYKTTRKQMNKWGVKFFTDVEIIEWGSFEESARLLKDRLQYSHCRLMYNRIQQRL